MASLLTLDHQVETDLPLDQAREAVWRVFWNEGIPSPVIDVSKNQVVGQTRTSFRHSGCQFLATFRCESEGLMIEIRALPVGPFLVRFEGLPKKCALMTEAIRREFGGSVELAASGEHVLMPAPIASPDGRIAPRPMIAPLYGPSPPVLRGHIVLGMGLICICGCVPLLGPLPLVYGLSVLRDYRGHQPKDRWKVFAGMALALAGMVFIVVLAIGCSNP